jgi:hypothetical protein
MTKATITYIGGPTTGDAKSTTWRGVMFPLGEAVEVTDEVLIRKAQGHPHFEVDLAEPDADDGKSSGKEKAKKAKGGKKEAEGADKEPDADDGA